jgi:hypothetical protein
MRRHFWPVQRTGRKIGLGRGLPATALAVVAAGAGALAMSPAGGSLAGASTTSAHRVVLTNQSNGSTTIVTKGEQVVVKLKSDGFDWTEASVVNASAENVLVQESGHVSSGGSSITKFLVVGYGTATLQATGTEKCSKTPPVCDPLLTHWSANVEAPVQDPPPTAA